MAADDQANSRNSRRLRQAARWASLVISTLIVTWPLWPGQAGNRLRAGAAFLPAASPFVALAAAIAARSVGVVALAAVPWLLLSILSRRWFCNCVCPAGFLQDWVPHRRLGERGAWWMHAPRLGHWAAMITLGGALLGYPLLLWLDPMSIFAAFGNAWRRPLTIASLAPAAGLPLLVLLSWLFPHLWCMRLCPLGSLQDILHRLPRWGIRRSSLAAPAAARSQLISCPLAPVPGGEGWGEGRNAKAPGNSESFQRLAAHAGLLPQCGGGGKEPRPPTCEIALRPPAKGVPRRTLVAMGAGAAVALTVRGRHTSGAVLRPPGSVPETGFTGLCIRCGNCASACPSGVIRPHCSGILGFMTPHLRFDDDYCREDCFRCAAACPTGAIRRLDLAHKARQVIGVARLNADTCLMAAGHECGLCKVRCPYDAITLQTSDGGFTVVPAVNVAACTGCGACEAVCPVSPVKAIRIVNPVVATI